MTTPEIEPIIEMKIASVRNSNNMSLDLKPIAFGLRLKAYKLCDSQG